MKVEDLRQEIESELELMEKTVGEISALLRDLQHRLPTVREKTAAAAFLAQFYGGIENILKRICRFHSAPLPEGSTWHTDLFKRFCFPPHPPLPGLFNESLASRLAPYRQFRHVFFHGYGFDLDWEKMLQGIVDAQEIFSLFKAQSWNYLKSLSDSPRDTKP